MNSRSYAPMPQAGFTLVELIVVMVITGILSGMVALFIRIPVQNYADSAARADLSDTADTAVRRMSRDIRLALPNSVRLLNPQTLELLLTKTGGRYLSASDGAAASLPVLSFESTAARSFTVVGAMPDLNPILANDFIVVYNLGPGFEPANAYAGGNIAAVEGTPVGNVVTLASNPFAAQVPPMPSPGSYFQVVTTPVTYRCAGGQLIRTDSYAITSDQLAEPAGQAAILATNVAACTFTYAGLQTQAGLVGVQITLQRPGNANQETVTLSQQIYVDNVP